MGFFTQRPKPVTLSNRENHAHGQMLFVILRIASQTRCKRLASPQAEEHRLKTMMNILQGHISLQFP